MLQLRLDSSSDAYGTSTPESTAQLAGLLDAEADAPQATPCPPPSSNRDNGEVDRDRDQDGTLPCGDRDPPASRGRQLAAALLRLVTRGRDGASRPTPPTRFTVLVDVDRLTDHTTGILQTALKGRPPRLVRRTIERLSCDATIDTIMRHGADLLAADRHAPEITAAVRRAIIARDGGCRWPACRAPIAWCDLHHVIPRAANGDHHPTNLLLLCRRHHTTVHRHGWNQHVDSDGTYQLRRHGRTITSLPRNTTGLPPPAPPDRRRPPRVSPAPKGRPPDGRPPARPPDHRGGSRSDPPPQLTFPDHHHDGTDLPF